MTVDKKNLSRADPPTISTLCLKSFPTKNYLNLFNLSKEPSCILSENEEESINHMTFRYPALASLRNCSSNMDWSDLLLNTNDGWSSVCEMVEERSARIRTIAKQSVA